MQKYCLTDWVLTPVTALCCLSDPKVQLRRPPRAEIVQPSSQGVTEPGLTVLQARLHLSLLPLLIHSFL